jgi:hypothetical protein
MADVFGIGHRIRRQLRELLTEIIIGVVADKNIADQRLVSPRRFAMKRPYVCGIDFLCRESKALFGKTIEATQRVLSGDADPAIVIHTVDQSTLQLILNDDVQAVVSPRRHCRPGSAKSLSRWKQATCESPALYCQALVLRADSVHCDNPHTLTDTDR